MYSNPATVSYRVNKRRPGTLRLWTLQQFHVWEALRQQGELFVDLALIRDFDFWQEPYNWMRVQMAQRIPGYGGRYPWWAYDYPLDLRAYRYLIGPPHTRHVRLELAVPREHVLLSTYGGWHSVLSRWYLPDAADEAAYEAQRRAWESELAAHGVDKGRVRPLPEPFESRLVASWERIFDVERYRERETIQATFERLALADVVRVTEFTARGRSVDPAV